MNKTIIAIAMLLVGTTIQANEFTNYSLDEQLCAKQLDNFISAIKTSSSAPQSLGDNTVWVGD